MTADPVPTQRVGLSITGDVEADIGVKNGRIFAAGKAGNPDIQPATIPIGAATEATLPKERSSPQAWIDIISTGFTAAGRRGWVSGVTTMIGGGTGPAAGTNATTLHAGPWYIARMLQAADTLPVILACWVKAAVLTGCPARATMPQGHQA